ncbi:hypothetical protein WH47_01053 [Habropoda laboriosa]|uniref:Uncharacterized protein n=1 Tax=Habropoda laboriosa TaxID=597456 RepID=A0A0L7R0U3_9HYME|nr:hypothetical protein WH47_01053 [Habropoda laboriosa]
MEMTLRWLGRPDLAKYDWSQDKTDKDTFTDQLEWSDKAICSCSDVEGGCTGKCPKCSGNDETHYTANDRTGSNQFIHLNCNRKGKKKKKQRFSFLQKNFQNKKNEKDRENRDKKKTLEKSVLKKREKTPIISQKDQCSCCRCTLNSKGICEISFVDFTILKFSDRFN